MPDGDHQPPRYQRPVESASPTVPSCKIISPTDHSAAIDASSLSGGSKALLRGLMRLAKTATYSGGGIGLDYAGLLKTAVRPDILQLHVNEASTVLREQQVDLLLVPGMSGFPVGTMYATVAGIPALLLRKEPSRRRAGTEAAAGIVHLAVVHQRWRGSDDGRPDRPAGHH